MKIVSVNQEKSESTIYYILVKFSEGLMKLHSMFQNWVAGPIVY